MLYNRQTGKAQSISESLDSSVDEFTFTPNSHDDLSLCRRSRTQPDLLRRSYWWASEEGRSPRVAPTRDVHLTADGKTLVFSRSSMTKPSEIFRADASGSGSVTALTTTNDAFISPFNLRPAEDVTWTGAGGAKVGGWLIQPPNFQPNRKYPLVVLIHGGPQGAWNDNWGYRWNPQIYANAGYVVFAPNPRGSTGYGQQFENEVSGDWGGKAFIDIMNGVAQTAALSYIDQNRIGAAGASYGGYDDQLDRRPQQRSPFPIQSARFT